MDRLMIQIQGLQDKENSFSDAKGFSDPEKTLKDQFQDWSMLSHGMSYDRNVMDQK